MLKSFSSYSADHPGLQTTDLKGINCSHGDSEIITLFFLGYSEISHRIHYPLMGRAEG
jgi:hypothetical protein